MHLLPRDQVTTMLRLCCDSLDVSGLFLAYVDSSETVRNRGSSGVICVRVSYISAKPMETAENQVLHCLCM